LKLLFKKHLKEQQNDNNKFNPKRDDLCLCKYSEDDQWYRAMVTKNEKGIIKVRYIDFGTEEKVNYENLKPISQELRNIQPLAKEAFLAFITPHSDLFREEAANFVRDFTLDKYCVGRHEYSNNGRIYLTISDKETGKINLNSALVENGLVFVSKSKNLSEFKSILEELSNKEAKSKQERLNLWQNDVFDE